MFPSLWIKLLICIYLDISEMARFIPFNFQGKLHFFLPRRKSPPFFLLFEQFIKRNSHLIGQYNSTRIQKIVISLILKMFVYIQDKNFFQGNSS